MLVRLAGNVSEVIPLQLKNAAVLIVVRVVGKITEVMVVLLKNALPSIAVTVFPIPSVAGIFRVAGTGSV